ncbi:MAG: type II toxin-antitoxin system HicA family toxin [Anaerolineales bacterium]|nr:type II toxin-antitoxin system HicA family toxin [Anaerolineales bacterium]
MDKFPVDAPKTQVVRAFERLGFRLVREKNHIAMLRENPDGTRTPLTMPNHRTIKSSTLRTILTQAGISRDDFMKAYEDAR